jgi:hypothetical protein
MVGKDRVEAGRMEKVQATVKGTASTAKLGSINGEESDMERE